VSHNKRTNPTDRFQDKNSNVSHTSLDTGIGEDIEMVETNESDRSETENHHRKFDGNLETMGNDLSESTSVGCQTLTLTPPMKFLILVNIRLNLFILLHLHVGLLSKKITLLVHTP
jgi:hypothetical protein